MLQLSHINNHIIIIFLSNFPIIFLTLAHFFKNIYTFSNLFLFLIFSSPHKALPYLFISLLHSSLISLFTFLFIFLFFVLSYLHSFTINLSFSLPFFTWFSLTKKGSLSLSLSQFFGGIFYFSCIFALGW